MTQKEIQDSIIYEMNLGARYFKDYFIASFAASNGLTEKEVADALDSIPSNIIETGIDNQTNKEYIRKIRVPMP